MFESKTLEDYLNLTQPSYIENVAEYWLKQPAPNPVVQNILAAVLFVVSIPSQICQLLVIFVFIR